MLLLYNTSGMHRHSCISMFRDDIGHISQALFSQIPYYQAFDWDFVIDHQDRHRWYELQWVHMIDCQYWECVLCSHGVSISRTWSLLAGITHMRILGTLELGRIIILSGFRGCLARGRVEKFVLICFDNIGY